MNYAKVIVTGDRKILQQVQLKDGRTVEWVSVPVLEFERLPVDSQWLQSLSEKPFDWILFSSPRAVKYWKETLEKSGVSFPLETQVACIGESTASVSEENGFYPDFYPTEPGSEAFLREFESMIALTAQRPSVLIPSSFSGRRLVEEGLQLLGCNVKWVPLYRTRSLSKLSEKLPVFEIQNASAFLFTSPSSVESFLNAWPLPTDRPILAMGTYTAGALLDRGVKAKLLPEGDFGKIAEVLCQ